MPVQFQQAPQQAIAALREGAQRVSASPVAQNATAAVLRSASLFTAQQVRGQDNPGDALPVHFPAFDQIRSGKLDATAPVLLWRHVLPSDAGAPAALAETQPVAGGAFRFASIAQGNQSSSILDSLRKAQSDSTLTSRQLVAASLQVNELGLRAVWLQAKDGGEDLIIPADPAPEGIQAGRQYTKSEILPLLQQAANKRAALASPDLDF